MEKSKQFLWLARKSVGAFVPNHTLRFPLAEENRLPNDIYIKKKTEEEEQGFLNFDHSIWIGGKIIWILNLDLNFIYKKNRREWNRRNWWNKNWRNCRNNWGRSRNSKAPFHLSDLCYNALTHQLLHLFAKSYAHISFFFLIIHIEFVEELRHLNM